MRTARAIHFHYNGPMPMNRLLRIAMLCLALLAGNGVSLAAMASEHGRERGNARVTADRAISLDEAVARAERRHDARAVRAEEKRRGDRIVYRIRLLGPDGRVFEVTVDAETGQEN